MTAVWAGGAPNVRERVVAGSALAIQLLAILNVFVFKRSLLDLSPKQFLAGVFLISLPLLVYWSRRVREGVQRTPDEVVRYLRDFIEGTGGDWDFDDFITMPIADPRLDSIRESASRFDGPKSAEGIAELKVLLAEAEAIASETEYPRSPVVVDDIAPPRLRR